MWILSISVIVVALLYLLMRMMLYRAFYHSPVEQGRKPGDFGLPFREISIATVNQKNLQAFFINEQAGGPVVVGIHGWENTAEKLLPLGVALVEKDIRLLLINTRNHGNSDPDSYSTMVKFSEDLMHAIDYLRSQIGEQIPVFLLGHSLGAATCIYVASKRRDIKGVISIAGFASLYKIIADGFLRKQFPGFLLPIVMAYMELAIGKKFEELSPQNAIARYDTPVLILHGSRDPVVPVRDAEILALNAGNNRVKKILITDAGHSSLLTNPALYEAVIRFIRQDMTLN